LSDRQKLNKIRRAYSRAENNFEWVGFIIFVTKRFLEGRQLNAVDKNYTIFYMKEEKSKCAEAQMLIRKPVQQVFEAFIDPELTKNFWFTMGSGRLEVDKKVNWHWEMYHVSSSVVAREIVENRKIVIEWGEPPTIAEFNFQALSDGSTYVIIRHYGFDKTGDALIEAIKDSTGGFTTVLDGLKAFLEHNINLNLIADKFPKEMSRHGA
jgi:uncharacterized protein YndB with AHSA1/START domain